MRCYIGAARGNFYSAIGACMLCASLSCPHLGVCLVLDMYRSAEGGAPPRPLLGGEHVALRRRPRVTPHLRAVPTRGVRPRLG
jgi:hypothetical protein